MKDLGASLVTVAAWAMSLVVIGAVARVAFELAVIGFTFLGFWPAR